MSKRVSPEEVTDHLHRYAPTYLDALAWGHAREAVSSVVVVAEPVTGREAGLLASRLCWFLASLPTGAWDRRTAPDLTLLLTDAAIVAATASEAMPGFAASSRAAYRQALRRLCRAQVGRRFVALKAPAAASMRAVRFWPAVAGCGPFTALAAAFVLNGSVLGGTNWAGIEQEVVWGLSHVLSEDQVIAAGKPTAAAVDRSIIGRVQEAATALRDATYPKESPSVTVVSPANGMTSQPRTSTVRATSAAAAKRIAKERQAARSAAQVRKESVAAGAGPTIKAPAPLPDALADALARWKPQGMPASEWVSISDATRVAIVAYRPISKATLSNCRPHIAAFAAFVLARPERLSSGVLNAAELVEEGLVEAFLGGPLSARPDPSRATARSILRRVVRALAPDSAPERIVYSPVQPPYTPIEAAMFARLSRNQPTEPLQRALSAMVALGLGAGLGAEDQRAIAPRDITEIDLSGGVRALAVTVPGDAPQGRTVIVRAEYEGLLREALALHAKARRGSATPLCGVKPDRHNGANRVAAKAVTASTTGIAISAARLRATWLVACMCSPVPLGALLHAAGLRTPRTLADLLPYCPVADPVAVAAALAAATPRASAGSSEMTSS